MTVEKQRLDDRSIDEGVLNDESGQVIAYRQIIDDLRSAVLQGDFDDGRRLPTERELQEEYGVGRQTVRRAYQELVVEGLVSRTRGRGSFAVTGRQPGRYLRSFESPERLLGLVADTGMEILEDFAPCEDERVAKILDADRLSTLLLRRFYEGQLLCVTRVFLRTELAGKLHLRSDSDHSSLTVIGELDKVLPGGIRGLRQFITAVLADPEQARLLNAAVGDPLLRVEHHFYGADEHIQEVGISYYRPDRYTHAVEIRRGA